MPEKVNMPRQTFPKIYNPDGYIDFVRSSYVLNGETLHDIYWICDYENVQVIKFRQLPIIWKIPILNTFCAIISPYKPVRATNKFLHFSRELILFGCGNKQQ